MESLNPQQHAAVQETQRPLLVIAGAGSGKTRVITEKIAHLVRNGHPARNIAAVTFTNKAAREMKSRITGLLSDREMRGLVVSTFHALGLEIIRREHKALGLKATLSIFDEQDRTALLKELIGPHGQHAEIDAAEWAAREISRRKGLFLLPHQPAPAQTPAPPEFDSLYLHYMQQMKAYNAIDFDDLILLPVVLFKEHSDILERWQNKLRYLLVDEYQDTNETQYQMMRLLVGKLARFTVVGDDDQSIYSWRGAQPENLSKLKIDFPALRIIKLEQNYRSSKRILGVANALIANNPHEITKKLWSNLPEGDPLIVLHHKDEVAESRQVCADLVHHRFKLATRYSDYAILYRSNHQARIFETSLRESGIPYFISGGQSFFSYSEVKDVLAYLRLSLNSDDDGAFLRVVNTPKREIGPRTLEKLSNYARRRELSLYEVIPEFGAREEVGEKAWHKLQHFRLHIERLKQGIQDLQDPFKRIEDFLDEIDFAGWLQETSKTPETAKRRLEHVSDLMSSLRRIHGENVEDEQPKSLDEVVNKILLLDILDRNQEENPGERVHLMTLHASKGLEFPFVYLVGMEENLLPHENSTDASGIEEERRLAYVGITRAQKRLTFSYCTHRKRRGDLEARQPSRFLDELPEKDLEWAAKKAIDPEIQRQRGQTSLNQLKSLLKS